MNKLFLAMAVAFIMSMSAHAYNNGYGQCIDCHTSDQYYMNGNGYVQPYQVQRLPNGKPRRYEDWTYLDENGYDYTIIIEVK